MENSLLIDLHMHSNVSDGSDAPEEILWNVKAAGIGLFALTDHDAVNGCRIIRSIREEEDPVFVTGVEFSCRMKRESITFLATDTIRKPRDLQKSSVRATSSVSRRCTAGWHFLRKPSDSRLRTKR